jgi:hypothetical protein
MGVNLEKQKLRETGRHGAIYIASNISTTGPFWKVQMLEAGQVSTMIASGITYSTKISSGTTLGVGAVFIGQIESLKLTTNGSAMGYKSS